MLPQDTLNHIICNSGAEFIGQAAYIPQLHQDHCRVRFSILKHGLQRSDPLILVKTPENLHAAAFGRTPACAGKIVILRPPGGGFVIGSFHFRYSAEIETGIGRLARSRSLHFLD